MAIVTLSGQIGTNARDVGRLAAERLGIDYVDQVMRGLDRSSAVGFAVPMSMWRYTCRESAPMISPPYRRARSIPSPVLPLPVGPTTAISVLVIHSPIPFVPFAR